MSALLRNYDEYHQVDDKRLLTAFDSLCEADRELLENRLQGGRYSDDDFELKAVLKRLRQAVLRET